MWGDYQVDDPNTLTQAQKDKIITQAKLLAGIAAAFTDEDVNVAANMAGEAVENNSFGVVVKAVKVAGKVFEVALRKGRIAPKDLQKIIKDSGLEIVSNVLTIADGQLTFDDAKAIIDIVVGTNFNNKQASRAAINRIVSSKIIATLTLKLLKSRQISKR